MGASSIRECEAFDDRALKDCSRIDCVVRVGEPIEKPPRRRVTPQIRERDDAPGQCGGRRAEHRLRHAEVKAHHDDPLPAANELSLHLQPSAECVYVETISRRRPKASDELDL